MSVEYQSGAAEFLLLDDEQLVAQCMVDCYRASGPGGQKRNKTSSAVRLRHTPTGLSASASDDRSQHVNKVRAIRRLRRTIALNVRSSVDLDRYAPSENLRDGLTSDGRFQVNKRDTRYALVLSEILDVLAACEMSVRESGKQLGMSTARIVKLLQLDSKLWAKVNEMRASAGAKPLRSSSR